ncbi:MAG: 50S ribosomal protein L18 [Candidatus Micrarchaeia archaeon]
MAKATRSTYKVPFRRRRIGKTDYKKRLALLKFGDRLVARKTSKRIIAQVVSFGANGDKIVSMATSSDLQKVGMPLAKSLPAAYLIGYKAAKDALKKGVKKAVLDMGRKTPAKASFAFAVLKGALDAGLDVPHDESVFDNDRFMGKHIAEYARLLKGSSPEEYKKRFSQYLKKGVAPEELPKLIDSLKSKL